MGADVRQDRDPLYFGGYAGAAQVETLLAIVGSRQPSETNLLRQADTNSAKALGMEPDAPWALSARAWYEFAIGNYGKASLLSQRASTLAPDDPHIVEFDALISLYTGEWSRILDQTDHYRKLAKINRSSVFENALGAAQFHSGDYGGAIRSFEDSITSGGPFGPIAAAYVMAAHWNNGDHEEARRLADIYMKTWPDFPLERIKRRAFADPERVLDLTEAMRAAGWDGHASGND